MKTVDNLFFYPCTSRSWIMATLLVRCQSLRDTQNAFSSTRSAVWTLNGQDWHEWMAHTVTQKCLTMGLYVNAKMERYAYFSVFSHNWLPFLLWHVEIGAVLQNPIIKHLNYNVSAIHPWYWLLLSFQISHQEKTKTPRTTQPCSWLPCHMPTCGHQVTWSAGRLILPKKWRAEVLDH